MALGGGTFATQNKVLPGSYINFINAKKASTNISDRGVVALPMEFDWGMDGAVFTVTAEDFQKKSLVLFGYDLYHEKMKGLRDLFKNTQKCHFYKLNSGGAKATNTYATALYSGQRGNAIIIKIEANENSTDLVKIYDVSTFIDTLRVDTQTVKTSAELKDNEFVSFKKDATLSLTAGSPLINGTNGTVEDANYQTFLDQIQSFSFNALGCLAAKETIKALFAAFTKRMRDTIGMKFQCVLHKYQKADHEGVISVENNTGTELVYWVTGAVAGCAVNKSNTNKLYDGEFAVEANYTQTQLESALKAGKFIMHKVGDTVRVLEDINTFITYTDEKGSDFSNNQTVRIIDQIGNDIAAIFNTKYLGLIPNDESGRISLWNDVVKHHKELEKIGAIEKFDSSKITISAGDTKKAVVIEDYVTPVNAMAQLYMTVIVQ